MKRFRKIIVDDTAYQWLFRYHGHKYRKKPYLLIIKDTAPDKAWKIEFSIADHFLLNSGLPAVFQGEQTVINLNRPKLISQIIQYCLDHEEEIPWDEHRPLNGISILQKMGFEIPPVFLDQSYRTDRKEGAHEPNDRWTLFYIQCLQRPDLRHPGEVPQVPRRRGCDGG